MVEELTKAPGSAGDLAARLEWTMRRTSLALLALDAAKRARVDVATPNLWRLV